MHATAPCFEPLLDFLSTSDSYVMQADVPGVAKPDLCVKLCQEQRVLMMAGKRVSSLTKTINLIQHNHDSHPDYRGNSRTHRHRPGASAAAGTSYILQQRLQGTFEHQLPLPDDADSGAIRAMLEDGVLTIIIRKINKNQNCPQQAWQDIAIT
jgi:HSP20 family molecular chaperone IbpA